LFDSWEVPRRSPGPSRGATRRAGGPRRREPRTRIRTGLEPPGRGGARTCAIAASRAKAA
jgi:hypothetical protein